MLCESRQFQFDVHGEVQRFVFCRYCLSEVDKVGKDLTGEENDDE